jgi:hypothetical protein
MPGTVVCVCTVAAIPVAIIAAAAIRTTLPLNVIRAVSLYALIDVIGRAPQKNE